MGKDYLFTVKGFPKEVVPSETEVSLRVNGSRCGTKFTVLQMKDGQNDTWDVYATVFQGEHLSTTQLEISKETGEGGGWETSPLMVRKA